MKRKDFFLFFLFPFVGVLILFFLFSSLNQNFIQRTVKQLISEQLQATAEILKVDIRHLLEEGVNPDTILKRFAAEENIYYMAILGRNNRILSWSSRYEGYLPFSTHDLTRKEPWTISSPAGEIYNLLTPLSQETDEPYLLYLGYSLRSLEQMSQRSKRNFLIIFAALASAGIFFFIGLFGLQKNYLKKVKEADQEKEEKEKFREISALTSGIAHEIKNPLNSLALLCELLHKKGPEEIKPDAALGKEEVHKISRIIDQFSAALKPLRLKKEKVFIHEVIESARRLLDRDKEKSRVVFESPENQPMVVEADKELLTSAIFNLLSNSFESAPTGPVVVQAKKHRKNVILSVEDSGKGIAPEDIRQIFEPFFTTKEKGMGIGLYLVKKIIEAHGGTVEVESELGRGTRFTLKLPGGSYE